MKAPCNPSDVVNRDIPLASFNATQVGSVDPALVGQGFLRQSALGAEAPHVLGENLAKLPFVRPFHGRQQFVLVLLSRTLLSHKAAQFLVLWGRAMKRVRLLLLIGLIFGWSTAWAAEWGPWPTSPAGHIVAAGYKHDDGGALVVMCDRASKLISLGLQEPRANWTPGSPKKFMTRADDGTQLNEDVGIVLDKTLLILKEPSTWHLSAMGKASATFAVGTGEYARIFPVANFRKAIEPVLAACGDHW